MFGNIWTCLRGYVASGERIVIERRRSRYLDIYLV